MTFEFPFLRSPKLNGLFLSFTIIWHFNGKILQLLLHKFFLPLLNLLLLLQPIFHSFLVVNPSFLWCRNEFFFPLEAIFLGHIEFKRIVFHFESSLYLTLFWYWHVCYNSMMSYRNINVRDNMYLLEIFSFYILREIKIFRNDYFHIF